MPQLTNSSKPLTFAVATMGGLFALTAYSQVKLQTWEQKQTIDLGKASKRYELPFTDWARRGSIYTSDGKPAAQDDESYTLTINYDKVPHCDPFYVELAEATGLPVTELSTIPPVPSRPSKVGPTKSWLDPVPSSRFRSVMAIKNKWRADGLSLKTNGQRTYPLGNSASCFVGVIKNYREKKVYTGLEHSLNGQLSGQNGFKVGLTDHNGAFLPMRMEKDGKPRVDGKDVVLTIDSDLQVFASEAIRKAVETNKADNGVAIAMNPKTGEILAMANWPSFDPNANSSQGQFGFNPAYMAHLEPGSTFKILTLAKAIDAGKVSMNDVVNCEGEWRPTPRTKIHCDKHHGNRAHGAVAPLSAIARSCNVSAAIWATKIGRTGFLDYIRDLGLTHKSKLNLPGEQWGNLNYKEPAQLLQLATLGFGQSVTCTPIGLIGAFGMLGNHGIRVEPRLISRVGSAVKTSPPGKRIVSPETAQKVMECMTAVVETSQGTGAKLRIPGYKLAGKTGTAQKVNKGEKGYVANFVGFVPANEPKAVILVMVNNPKNGLIYGADVAGPVFQQMAKAVIRHYNIAPTEPIRPVAPKEHIEASVNSEIKD